MTGMTGSSVGGPEGLPTRLPPLRARLPRREHHSEILDGPGVPPEERSRSLRAMERVNRYLGGARSLVGPVAAVADTLERPVRILDVGTGNGNIPRELARRLQRDGPRPRSIEWVGLDRCAATLRVAHSCTTTSGSGAGGRSGRHAGTRCGGLIQADGTVLPFRSGAFDVVLSSLTLHHLDDPAVPGFLAELCRVARRRVLVSDLERHPLHYAGARLLSGTLWRHDRVTRIDGPLSVLRSFTRSELEALASRAPFRVVKVRRHFPFRLVLDGVPE